MLLVVSSLKLTDIGNKLETGFNDWGKVSLKPRSIGEHFKFKNGTNEYVIGQLKLHPINEATGINGMSSKLLKAGATHD